MSNNTGRFERALFLLCALVAAQNVLAGLWFSPSHGADGVDRWDDPDCWYQWHSFSEKAADYRAETDVNLIRPGTILVDSDIGVNYWEVKAGAEGEKPVILRIDEGGALRTSNGTYLGAKPFGLGGGPSVLDIRAGGMVQTPLVVGDAGPAVVENAGTLRFNSRLDIRCGEIRMRGGLVESQTPFNPGGGGVQLWIGDAADGGGAVDADACGVLSGWGRVSGVGDETRIWARVGNGRIVADGEGAERVLDCSDWASVSNVLASADAAGGWYAVDKGAVIFPVVNAAVDTNGGGDDWNCFAGTNSVGCARRLKTPDLVNAVHITANRDWQDAGWNFGVMLLADDRPDAHAAELPARCRPLGFWKAGTFGKRIGLDDVRPFKKAGIRFRYDADRIRKEDSSLVVLRWDEALQEWRRLQRYWTQPEDGVVTSGELTENSGDRAWTLGLFCVAECAREGLSVVIR